MGGYKDIIFQLLIFAAVLAAAYFTARYISKRGLRSAKSRHMHVADRLMLSRDKAVYLVKVGKKYYLLGATNQQISILGKPEIDEEDGPGDKEQGPAFSSFMARAVRRKGPPAGGGEAEEASRKKGFSIKKARGAWKRLMQRKRENEELLRRYRQEHRRKEEDE